MLNEAEVGDVGREGAVHRPVVGVAALALSSSSSSLSGLSPVIGVYPCIDPVGEGTLGFVTTPLGIL